MVESSTARTEAAPPDHDVVVGGAGFAGLYMLHKLRQGGFKARVYEAGDDVGGTWYWNRYPGARCDVESMQYSYSFDEQLQQEWNWTERYPEQAEILRYIHHVAERFELRKDVQLETAITAARYDEATGLWTVELSTGESVTARYCVMATGALSAARKPALEGLDDFNGSWYHTGRWPHEDPDFSGLRVAVIGTGSSGIQAIPEIAKQAKQVVVFQRTPNFSIPAWNGPLDDASQAEWKAHYAEQRAKARNTRSGILYEYSSRGAFDVDEQERQREFERRWARGGANFTHAFNDIFINQASNDKAAEFVRDKIRSIVRDPEVARKLTPTDHPIGTKRICVDTDYYDTFNRANVTLVDVRETPVVRADASGLQTSAQHFDLDAIVFATGYDAVTGAVSRIHIEGRGGRVLKAKWSEGPRTYLGLMTNGFPNLFTVTGPGSPSVLTNVIVSIEQHVEWIADCLNYMRQHAQSVIEPSLDAEDEWVRQVNQVAAGTLFPSAASWYMGANIPGKPRVFLPYVGGFDRYRRIAAEVAADGYRGFSLD